MKSWSAVNYFSLLGAQVVSVHVCGFDWWEPDVLWHRVQAWKHSSEDILIIWQHVHGVKLFCFTKGVLLNSVPVTIWGFSPVTSAVCSKVDIYLEFCRHLSLIYVLVYIFRWTEIECVFCEWLCDGFLDVYLIYCRVYLRIKGFNIVFHIRLNYN